MVVFSVYLVTLNRVPFYVLALSPLEQSYISRVTASAGSDFCGSAKCHLHVSV